MSSIPTEEFGFTLKQPEPTQFGLSAKEVETFRTKTGIFRMFDAEYSKVSHKKDAYNRFKKALEDYTNACYRGRQEFWLSMSPTEFEYEVARVFQALGWQARVIGGSGDKGVDITLRKDGQFAIVQCKAYNKTVGPSAVRELHSVVISQRAKRGYLVSTRGFSRAASEEATGKPVVLIHSGDLANAELGSIADNLGEFHMKGSRLLWPEEWHDM